MFDVGFEPPSGASRAAALPQTLEFHRVDLNRDKALANAQKHIRKGNWDRAIREYEKLVEADPADVRSKLKIADLHIKENRLEEALDGYRAVAHHYAREDIYEKAVAVYKQALRIAPEDAYLHRDLGEAYFRLGRLKDAVRAFNKAQKIFKAEGDAINQRQILERMVELDPDDVGLQIQLAERYEKDGLRDESLELFRTCADRLHEEGRLDAFVQVAERIVYLQRSDVELRKRIVRIYLDREDNRHALKHLQVCFRELPQDIDTLEMLSTAFSRLGSVDKALLVLKELAGLYKSSGDEARVHGTFRKVLQIDPNDRDARRVLGENEFDDSGALPAIPDNTGSLSAPAHTEDALAGIEFLDDDLGFLDADDVEMGDAPTGNGQEGSNGVGVEATRAAEIVDIEAADLEEISSAQALRGSDDDEIAQLLTETEVFLKYGLMDRAEQVLSRIIEIAPANLVAREQMRKYLEMNGDTEAAADQLLEMARLTAATPPRSAAFLERARGLASDPARIDEAAAHFEDLSDPFTELAELSMSFIEEVSGSIDEISEATGPDDFENRGADSIELVHDVELFDGGELDDFGDLGELNGFEDFDDVGLVDMDGFAGIDDISVAEDLRVASDAELAGDLDGADILDLDLDVSFDDGQLAALDSAADGDDFEFSFDDDDAERMFDELFGADDDDAPPADKTAEQLAHQTGGDEDSFATPMPQTRPDAQPLAGLEAVDAYVAEGKLDQATRALSAFEADNPGHFGIERRRMRIESAGMNGGLSVGTNAFGASSLSGQFQAAIDTGSEPSEVIASEIQNTNLELGITYREMGLFDEAIEEFEQATDDPDAAAEAQLNIALCEIELGRSNVATERLTELSDDEAAPEHVRASAREKLTDLQRETAGA